MDPELQELLIGAQTRAVNEFQTKYASSVYNELEDVHTDPRGYVKLFATAEGAQFERFRGKGKASAFTERGYNLIADLFTYHKQIPRQKWDQLMAWLGSNLAGIMASAGAKAALKKDLLHTENLDSAVGGASIASLYHDTVFLGKIKLPGSGTGAAAVSINNRIDGGDLTEANLREAFYKVSEALADFQFPDGTPYFAPEDEAQDLRMMFAPTGKMLQLIDNVFDTGVRTANETVSRIKGLMPKRNSLWNNKKFSNLNGRGGDAAGGVLFYKPVTGNLRLLQFVQPSAGVEIQHDMPQNSQQGSMFVPADQQFSQQYTMTALRNMEAGYGSPMQAIWVDFANVR